MLGDGLGQRQRRFGKEPDGGLHRGRQLQAGFESIRFQERQKGLVGVVRQIHAVAHELDAIRVIGASAGADVQKPARQSGVMQLARIGVLQLDQAAERTAVAQRLPLPIRHLGEGLAAPKGLIRGIHLLSLSVKLPESQL